MKLPADIISCVDLDTILAGKFAARLKGKPLVFDAHEIFYEVPELSGKPIKKAIWRWIARKTVPASTRAYTVNKALKDHYESNYNTSFEVIYNVPDKLSFKGFNDGNRSNIIVYLGVLNKGRGLELAIEAMATLKEYQLLIIGDGDISKKLKNLSAELNLKDRVEFLGYIHPEHIATHLRQAKIAINILEGDSENYRLSLANKFFDYLHAGIPSINMAYPEYQSIIKEYEVGVCIDNYTVPDFISAVRQLEDQIYYNSIITHCAAAKEKYVWHNEVPKLRRLYAEAAIPL